MKHLDVKRAKEEVSRIVKCSYCGKEIYLPFKCPYCGQYFCAEHRLPENHNCPEIWRAKAPKREVVARPSQEVTYSYPLTYQTQVSREKAIFFSLTELKHIAIGTLLVFMVGLSPCISQFIFYGTITPKELIIFIVLALILSVSFLLHELAHKIVAQIQGLWAEFRLIFFGALLTLISIFTPFFKIISPGAVVMAGLSKIDEVGKTAFAGPLTNMIIATFLIPLLNFGSLGIFSLAAAYGAWINSFMAFFNLIPFGIMDGLKVLLWDKRVWAAAFVISIILMVYTGMIFFRV